MRSTHQKSLISILRRRTSRSTISCSALSSLLNRVSACAPKDATLPIRRSVMNLNRVFASPKKILWNRLRYTFRRSRKVMLKALRTHLLYCAQWKVLLHWNMHITRARCHCAAQLTAAAILRVGRQSSSKCFMANGCRSMKQSNLPLSTGRT